MIEITHATIEGLINPLGITIRKPLIQWYYRDFETQSAYEIDVVIDHVTYQTGKVSTASSFYTFDFPLKSRNRVNINITVYDMNGEKSKPFSVFFEMGILPEDFKAQWINPEIDHTPTIKTIDYHSAKLHMHHTMKKKDLDDIYQQRPASYLRKTFQLDSIKKARLYITSHGIYNVYINGKHIEDFFMAPGASQYDQLMPYQTYDVSSYLHVGLNEMVVVLGNGWWRGQVLNTAHINTFGDDVALLCQLEVNKRIVVTSDDTWEASQEGPLRDTDNMNGEIYDARKEDIKIWHPVKIEDFTKDNLYVSHNQHIKKQERFVGEIIDIHKDEYIIDFKQNISGIIHFELHAKKDDTIQIIHGETLDKHGQLTIENIQNVKGVKQEVLYTCKDGLNVYETTNAYFGFRYIKVKTNIPIKGDEFVAIATYTDMKQRGFFECGNPELNQLFHNVLWSIKSNFVDVPTDCPHREKAGYTGDLQTITHTAMYLFDSYPLIRKYLHNLASSQFSDGCIRQVSPDLLPRHPWDGGAGWADAITLVPYRMFLHDGDSSLLIDLYPTLKKWVDFNIERATTTRDENLSNPYHMYLLDAGMHWGEWMEPGVSPMQVLQQIGMHGEPEVATAYFYKSVCIVSEVAKLMRNLDDEIHYENIAENIKKAYQYHINQHSDYMDNTRMCVYVRPLAFDLLEKEQALAAAKRLNQLIIDNDYKINTGFLSTHELLPVLTKYGYVDTAYRVLLQPDIPGWLYAVKHGATTVWEQWNGIDENGDVHGSLNHYAYGAVVSWFFSGIAGIQMQNDAIVISPHVYEPLHYVTCTYQSTHGEIVSNWKIIDKEIHYHIRIPAGKTATIKLKHNTYHHISSGIHEFCEPYKK